MRTPHPRCGSSKISYATGYAHESHSVPSLSRNSSPPRRSSQTSETAARTVKAELSHSPSKGWYMATIVPSTTARVLNSSLAQKIMSADEAAALIKSGDQVGMSGFTGSGYPKVVPIELARHIANANFRGQKFQVSVFTGASTGPELDGALAMAGGINLRLPYQYDKETRKRIKAGEMD